MFLVGSLIVENVLILDSTHKKYILQFIKLFWNKQYGGEISL